MEYSDEKKKIWFWKSKRRGERSLTPRSKRFSQKRTSVHLMCFQCCTSCTVNLYHILFSCSCFPQVSRGSLFSADANFHCVFIVSKYFKRRARGNERRKKKKNNNLFARDFINHLNVISSQCGLLPVNM